MIHTVSKSPDDVCEGCGKVHDPEVARLAVLAADACLLVCQLAGKLTEVNVAIAALSASRIQNSVFAKLMRYHHKLIIVLHGATERYIRRDLARHEARRVEVAERASEGMTVN